MSKRKKIKRTLNTIGEEYYNFDFAKEMKIYEYLCYKDMNKKLKHELDGKNLFEFYWEWKNYICNKYNEYDDVKLNEFSRYLNQRIRCGIPGREYMKLFFPVLVTLGLENIIRLIFTFSFDSTIPLRWNILMLFIIEVVFAISILVIIKMTFTPMIEENNQQNMLIDYKEVIDDILEKRKEEKEK